MTLKKKQAVVVAGALVLGLTATAVPEAAVITRANIGAAKAAVYGPAGVAAVNAGVEIRLAPATLSPTAGLPGVKNVSLDAVRAAAPGEALVPRIEKAGAVPVYYGRYVGLSLAVAQGAPFEKSVVSFSYESDRLIVDEVLSNGKRIKVSYSKDWLSNRAGSSKLPEECLALKQALGSTLAKVIICFGEGGVSGSKLKTQASMTLGEGMPLPLAVFLRQEQATPENLSALYHLIRAEAGNPPVRTFQQRNRMRGDLPYLDITEAQKVLSGGGSALGKKAVLEKAGHSLWTGTSREIQERMGLIRIGLSDSDPYVKTAALEAFLIGGRLNPGVEMVLDVLKDAEKLPDMVVNAAVEAASVLLYESSDYNKDAKLLRQKFGSEDFDVILRRSNGIVEPEILDSLDNILRERTPERRWTLQHQQSLRRGLARIAKNAGGTFPSRAVEKAKAALKDYPMP